MSNEWQSPGSWSFLRDFFRVGTPSEATQVECNGCGILFSIPALYAAAKERKQEKIYCPNGHQVLLGDKL